MKLFICGEWAHTEKVIAFDGEIQKLVEKNMISNTAHNIIFAIPLDNPITTEANKCRYDVCTIYPSDQNTHIGR